MCADFVANLCSQLFNCMAQYVQLSCGLPPEAGDEADDDEEEIPVEMSVSVSQTTDTLSSKMFGKITKSDGCQF